MTRTALVFTVPAALVLLLASALLLMGLDLSVEEFARYGYNARILEV